MLASLTILLTIATPLASNSTPESFLAASPGSICADRPNIVWLVVEDMSPWLPCYGDNTVPTPKFDGKDRILAGG